MRKHGSMVKQSRLQRKTAMVLQTGCPYSVGLVAGICLSISGGRGGAKLQKAGAAGSKRMLCTTFVDCNWHDTFSRAQIVNIKALFSVSQHNLEFKIDM